MTTKKMKIIITSLAKSESDYSSLIANRLSGLEFNNLSFDKKHTTLRLLELSWNNVVDVELWDISVANYTLPAIATFEANGLILISNETPKNFIEKNSTLFANRDFPLLWMIPSKHNRPITSSGFSSYNITKVQFTSANDDSIHSEFNNWITKLHKNLKR
ncbi:hypothetical protein B4U80_03007 [Leptotrombidium deliense]|uniref:Uncharacterized protein n=1 Tax=Leptotrombidium deliense TaxID=299467 RepID=A0A443SGU1_9ACAR|nr:hypothetical protein B4U80_03007 [Leptotrombidium deliense]